MEIPSADELNAMNDSELRVISEASTGKFINVHTPRSQLLAHLMLGEQLPENPLDRVRKHQCCTLLSRYAVYKTQMTCDTNCFAHEDLQVVECQVSNESDDAIRHPDYPLNPN